MRRRFTTAVRTGRRRNTMDHGSSASETDEGPYIVQQQCRCCGNSGKIMEGDMSWFRALPMSRGRRKPPNESAGKNAACVRTT